mmetsp:Transcript_55900/g.111064  ORF Transcript_55900/g.111064 Transcript_55900/m.111064 type:complete len:682 (-) Transcript_55900:334-2379(-)
MALVLLVAAWSLLPAVALNSGVAVTPVEKVVQLLGKLSEQIAEEGAKEAAEYDKYACFCKEQADFKQNSIEKSDEKLAKLGATIEKLSAEIADLNADIAALGKKISKLEEDMAKEKKKRDKEHKDYVKKDTDVTEAIEACRAAIEALKKPKEDMTKDAKVDLVQVAALSKRYPTNPQLQMITALLEQKPPSYVFRSNDIIQLLQRLLVDFKDNKQQLFEDEFALKEIFDEKMLGMQNEKKFKTAEKKKKAAISDAKTEDKEAKEADKKAETDAKDSDKEFLDELTKQCQTKAEEWDQRSTARTAELTAISEATEILKAGVDPNYGANKKLVGLQVAATASSFLQRVQVHRGAGRRDAVAAQTELVHRTLRLLDASATKLQSATLSAMTAKIALEEDHFVKVRGLIKDIIAMLKAQAEAEADQKSFCDKEMAKALKNRDGEKAKMEESGATIATKKAEKQQLIGDVAEISGEIAELAKALNEATELRSEEKKDNLQTLEEAKAGKGAVEQAMEVLKGFYGEFLQYKPPKSDREGKTVEDRAPETSFSGDYKGKQDGSKGIIGLLEVILADFERTIDKVGDEEKDAEKKFDEFKTETDKSTKKKEGEKTKKETGIKEATAAITEAKDANKAAEGLHEAALEGLSKLKEMCVDGEESYKDRVKKREEEIASLKEALKILQEYKD